MRLAQWTDYGSANAGPYQLTGPYYLTRFTDERGQATTVYRHTNTAFPYQIDYPDGGHRYFQYQGFGVNGYAFYKVQCVTGQRGAQVIYGYDETDVAHGGSGFAGLLTSVTRSFADGYGATRQEKTRLYYDNLDRVTRSVDPRGVTELYAYNARGQVIRVTHGDNTYVEYGYDDLGNRTGVRDELGHVATTEYDEYRRVTRTTVPVNDGVNAPRFRKFAYERRDGSGGITASALSHTSATWCVSSVNSGKAVQRVYTQNEWLADDYAGAKLNASSKPLAGDGYVHQGYEYNALGQVRKTTDAQGQEWKNTYDVCGHLSTVDDPLAPYNGSNHTTTYGYFGPGETDEAGAPSAGLLRSVVGPQPDLSYPRVTSRDTSHDAMGRVLETKNPRSVAFQSAFNVAGDLTVQSDGAQAAGQHTLGYNRDQLGRRIGLAYPDGTTEGWTYDASGNAATYKNRAGATKTMSYDGRNRLAFTHWSDGSVSDVVYTYDAASRPTRVQNGTADIRYTYDDAGAVLTESAQHTGQAAVQTTRYDHDEDGNVVAISYPNGYNVPQFRYDDQQRCTGMYSGSTTFSRLRYFRNWLVGRWIYPDVFTGYGYQQNGRVADLWPMP